MLLGGSEGIQIEHGHLHRYLRLLGIYGALAVVAFFFSRLKGSRMGLALEAIREDESAARTMGINVTFYKTAAYVTGAFIAGLAGALYAHALPILIPGSFDFSEAVNILTFAVVGGTFAWPGALLGAVLITILPEVLRYVPVVGDINIKDQPEIFSGVILLLVILFLPNGLLSAALKLNVRRPDVKQLPEQLAATLDEGLTDEQGAARTGAGPRETLP